MLNLNGVDIPSFVKVNRVGYSLLPTVNNNTLSVRGRKGVFLYGQELSDRKIEVDFTIIASAVNGVLTKARVLGSWLFHQEPVKLILADEPDKYYLVVPDGDTNIDEAFKTGTGTMTFLCVDTVAYGADKSLTVKPAADAIFQVNVGGNAETYPEIEVTTTTDLTSLALVNGDGAIILGEPTDVQTTSTNTFPTRLNDHLENVALWSNGVTVDDGVVYGDMTSTTGYGVSQTGKDYGTYASGWHGAAKVRALPAPIKDFEVTTWFTHSATENKQVGRVELYLRGENGKHIGKVALLDTNTIAEFPWMEARAGDYNFSDGYTFASGFGNFKYGQWKKFYGIMRISRKGNKWTVYIARVDGDKHKDVYTKSWIDTKNEFSAVKLASVQIHVGAYKATKPTNFLQVSRVMVKEYVVLSNGQAPIIVEAGDVLRFDCAKSIVYKNNEVFYEGINPSSTFFSLNPGANGLAVTAPGTTVKVNYTERWL
ncbi:distal tail protein Dit [Peribacillus muralis]|uniref:distal tail protein Dit n=1 Tax=Peribacillus muralis TaxID=264697 RepID=UPI0036729A04